MKEDTVVALPRPGSSLADDPLLGVLREGARRMLMQAIEAEVEAFLAAHADQTDDRGRRRVVRNGHAPERQIQTGIGPLEVRRPRVRDRGAAAEAPIRFTSAILPAYLRRTRNIEELLPWLYLKGVSTGQFEEALAALLGPEAPGLSAATVRRLTAAWQEEHARWQGRDLSTRRYVYLWADGVYFTPRLEHERQCLLVLIGADAAAGRSCWRSRMAFARAPRAGMSSCCGCATRTGSCSAPSSPPATVLWVSGRPCIRSGPSTRQQRCWVHKRAMVNFGDAGQAATCSSVARTASPSRKRTPGITWARRSGRPADASDVRPTWRA